METYQVYYVKADTDPKEYESKFKNIRAKSPMEAMLLFREKYPGLIVVLVV